MLQVQDRGRERENHLDKKANDPFGSMSLFISFFLLLCGKTFWKNFLSHTKRPHLRQLKISYFDYEQKQGGNENGERKRFSQ